MSYIENNLIDSVRYMYMLVDSLIKTNNIIAASNNITLRKVNVNSNGFDKMYMDKDPIDDMLYQIIDQFNERRTTTVKFYLILLKQNTTVLWWNGRMRKMIIKLLVRTEN